MVVMVVVIPAIVLRHPVIGPIDDLATDGGDGRPRVTHRRRAYDLSAADVALRRMRQRWVDVERRVEL